MIIASAIKFFPKDSEFPIIWTGKRHADILEDIFKHGIEYDKQKMTQGFLTHNKQFLDRYEARDYAIDCSQVENTELAELYSEDLWPEDD